jgi:hypothetical protein
MLKAILGRFTGTQRATPPRPSERSYTHVWWILDPTHTHHCEDCKHMAAHSPYGAPGSGSNELSQVPGDGETSCGADCTCILSYAPPGPTNPDMAAFQKRRPLARLLKTYTHGQARFIEEYGLEVRGIALLDQVDALVLRDGRLVKPGEYQCFLTSEDGKDIQWWEYPAETPFPPEGKWRTTFDESRRLVAQWPVEQIRWVLSPQALRRYAATAPNVPEWGDADENRPLDETIARKVLAVALEAARAHGCTVTDMPDSSNVRPSYHHVGYDVRLHGTRVFTFKNWNSRGRLMFLHIHVVPVQSTDGERYVVRSCLLD